MLVIGGFGSGGYNRIKPTLEHTHAIDVREWKRKGLLDKACSFICSWKDGDHTNSVSGKYKNEQVTLTYTANKTNKVLDIIDLDKTPCYYGGYRYWVICPSCEKRAAKLYLRSTYFRCRECHNLNYRSSQKSGDVIEQIDCKIIKLYKKLEGDAKQFSDMLWRVPSKPKHMHYKTYTELHQELWNLYNIRHSTFAAIARERFGMTV